MSKRLLGLGTNSQFGISDEKQAELFSRAGFDASFLCWGYGTSVKEFSDILKKNHLIFQSVHAPYIHMNDIWHGNREKSETAIKELLNCLFDCIRNEVPIMVMHAFIGFEDHSPCNAGIERIGKIIKAAEGSGVKIAFENTEGEEYLDAVMNAFGNDKNVGFCWDSGHEICYNKSADLLKKYGDRMLCTHLNDNMGIKDPDGKITYFDDLHLLPFDGIADWNSIAERLKNINYTGVLTFELNTVSKPGRHENDRYFSMPIAEYISVAYSRALKVALL